MNENAETIPTVTKPSLAARIGKVLSHHATKSGFSTALVYEPDEAAFLEHGSLYFVIDIASPSPLSADIAYNLIDIIKEEYYSDLALSAGESFENALKAANSELAAIAKEGEKDWIGKMNIIVAAVQGKNMFIVQRGTAEAHLLRQGNMTNLSKGMYTPGETYRPEETLSNLIEGEIEVEDKIVVSTSELFYYISIDNLKRLIANNTPAQAAKSLATMLEQEDEINRTSVLISEFNTPELLSQEEETGPSENWVGKPAAIKSKTAPRRARVWPAVAPKEINKSQTVEEAMDTTDETAEIVDEPTQAKEKSHPREREAIVIKEEEETLKTKRSAPSIRSYQTKVGFDSDKLKNIGDITLKIVKATGLILLAIADIIATFVANVVKQIRKQPNGDKILIGIAVVLAAVIVVSTFALARGYSGRVSTRQATAALTEAQQKRDAAQASLIYEDVVRTRTLLAEAYVLAESATTNARTEKEAALLLADLREQLDDVSAVNRFTGVQPLVDFDVLSAQLASSAGSEAAVQIGELVILGGNVYTIDPSNNKVYKFKTSSGEAVISNSLVSSNKALSLASAMGDSEIIFYTVPPSIYSLNLVNNSMVNVPLDEGDWNNADNLIAYTDKLYFLDRVNSQIWKYKKTPDSQYTQIAAYFETGAADLTKALDFAIDGNIFVLSDGNIIEKYLGGEKIEFALAELPHPYPALGNITHIYTDAASQLYLLDATNNRVVKYDKEGTYLGQYIYDNIENPQDLFVDEATGYIYLSAGTSVYRLPLE
ncbi:hypothetical protein DRH29_02390 [candidate division Kazan bacterium]|uniref:PPM-type phosphatase domain-containing protein n=1 Tax=candidate division Kazan bacterium TaxID=2202143 RepID=A0A420ZCS9_UNCK3|nr:MAG: hypothetical protein DRH29_02390 [candidate division Kazan bacterium]